MAVIGSMWVGTFGVMLIVRNVAEACDFYREVLGAVEIRRHYAPSPIDPPAEEACSSEMRLGETYLMVVKENPNWPQAPRPDWPRSPQSVGAPSAGYRIYVDDVDAVLARALKAGATPRIAGGDTPEDSYFGDRIAQFYDPAGHVWTVLTWIEDVAPEQLPARMEAVRERRQQPRIAS